ARRRTRRAREQSEDQRDDEASRHDRHHQMFRASFASSLAISRGFQGGSHTSSTFASEMPGRQEMTSWTCDRSMGPYGHMGEVRVMRTVSFFPSSAKSAP